MDLGSEDFKEIILARFIRTKTYLQEYIKQIPIYLMVLRHKFEHPLSELHILTQQLVPYSEFEVNLHLIDSKSGISQDLNYFNLALNEIKTALKYLKKKKNVEVFQEMGNEELDRKITQIIRILEGIKSEIN